MKTLKSIIAIVSFMLALTSVQAQEDSIQAQSDSSKTATPFCRHEFSIWGAGGWSSLNYKPAFGDRDLKAGGALGLGYTFYPAQWLGIHTGAEVALYNTAYKLQNLKDSYTRNGFDDLTPDWTGENEKIDYHTELRNYTERQQLYSLNIPLMLQFQTALANDKHQFYVSVGAKLGIPLKGTYKVTDATVYTWYYDYKSNQEFRPNPADYGNTYLEDLGCFYDKHYTSGKRDVKFKLAGLASFETGVKWGLSRKLSLYTGFYIDYGFNNIGKESANNFYEFKPEDATLSSNSILTSQYGKYNAAMQQSDAPKDFAERVAPLSFGIKLRLGVNMCKLPKEDKKEEQKKEKKEDKESLFDAYRKGFQDASAAAKSEPFRSDNDEFPRRNNAKTPQQVKPHDNSNEDYQSDPMYNIEMARAQAEYGKLTDLLILYVDGYELNQAYLSPTMKKILDDRIRLLQKYNSDKYIIIAEGHTCDLGREDFNMALGQKRADVVRDYMIGKGYNGDNIITVSKGETTPIVGNDSEANRKINRRVVFLIKEKR